MSFVTFLTLQTYRLPADLARTRATMAFLQDSFNASAVVFIVQGDYPNVWRAALSEPGRRPEKKDSPLLLPPPAKKDPFLVLKEKRRRDPRYPRFVELVIHNTERMPNDYMKGMLQRVFKEESVEAQAHAYLYPRIHKGPYPKDIAKAKAVEVRMDAYDHNMPIPVLRYHRV